MKIQERSRIELDPAEINWPSTKTNYQITWINVLEKFKLSLFSTSIFEDQSVF